MRRREFLGAMLASPLLAGESAGISSGIEARLAFADSYQVGDPLQASVTMINREKEQVDLMSTPFCSSTRGYYPRMSLAIHDASGKDVGEDWLAEYNKALYAKMREHGEFFIFENHCDPLKPGDFRSLNPGEELKVYQPPPVGLHGNLLLREGKAPAAGEYTLTFTYDTRNADPERWLVSSRTPPELVRRWERVPKGINIELRASLRVER